MKVIVVEDEVRIREGIRDLIDMLEDEWEFAGEAENGEAGLELIRSIHPEVVGYPYGENGRAGDAGGGQSRRP